MSLNIDPLGAVVTVDSTSSIPDWLTPAPDLDPEQVRTELVETQFQSMFMRVLDELVSGKTLTAIIEEDFRGFKAGAFLKWIKKDQQRHNLYKEAKELRTETWASQIIEIADAEDSLEDVNRSKLRIDSRKWLMGADNRKQYGETKTIDVGGSINLIGALQAANDRIIEMADVTDITPRLKDY